MDTWDDLRRYLGQRFAIHLDDPVQGLLTAQPPDVDMKFGLRRLDAGGTPWVLICIKLGAADRFASMAPLDSAFDAPIGFFFEHGGALGVGQKLPLSSLTPACVDQVVEELIDMTTKARDQFMAAGAMDDSVFDHFID